MSLYLCLFVLQVLSVGVVHVQAATGSPTLEAGYDTLGIPDYCPFSGSLQDLRRYGNRLLYEGKPVLAHACHIKAINQALDPEGLESGDASWSGGEGPPLPRFAELELFKRSRHMTNEDFDTMEDLARHLHRRTLESLDLENADQEARDAAAAAAERR